MDKPKNNPNHGVYENTEWINPNNRLDKNQESFAWKVITVDSFLKRTRARIEQEVFEGIIQEVGRLQAIEKAIQDYSGDNTYDSVIAWLESTTGYKGKE